jgi:NADH dehydrogenase
MAKEIVIIGAGFAGLLAALSAARLRDEKGVSSANLKITVVAPEPALIIRPRLYERDPASMAAPLSELFAATDIDFRAGWVDAIDADNGRIGVKSADGRIDSLSYDRLIVAAGSHGFQPPIPGLSDFGHSVTDRDGAIALDKHLHGLAERPDSPARNTVVVGGGGFTGIEVATEMPDRLREILGQNTPVRVIIVEHGPCVASRHGCANWASKRSSARVSQGSTRAA